MDHVATHPVRTKRPREGDTGHVITGIGYSWSCSCGDSGKVLPTFRGAYDDGRAHAAMHREQESTGDETCARCGAIAPYGCQANPCSWPEATRDAANRRWLAHRDEPGAV